MAIKIGLLLASAIILALAGISLFQSTPASAHGETVLIVDDVISGPYLFRVGIVPTKPTVGTLRVNTLIQPAEGDAPISDGKIVISAIGPESGTSIGPVRASNSLEAPQLFEASIDLTVIGAWTMTISADSSLGKATLDIPLEVTENTGGGLNFLIILIIAALAVIIVALVWSQLQRGRDST